MYRLSDVAVVHLEVTARCNASCPMCPRNQGGGPPNPNLPIHELSLGDVERIFAPGFVGQLRKLYLCGNFGDPAAAADGLPILRYLRAHGPRLDLGIHSNGGVRGAEWWRAIAPIVSSCRFGIDGLEDTNHLYRQGVRWGALMRNVEAFIAAGGAAEWVFLVFRHNQHQVEEARRRSEAMGFRRFTIKSTSRFPASRDGAPPRLVVKDARGAPSHVIEPPSLARFANPATRARAELERRAGGLAGHLEGCAIRCKAAQERSLYVDAGGHVLPCCWTAGEMYAPGPPRGGRIWSLLGRLPEGERSISALERSLATIVEGELFQDWIPAAWAPGDLGTTRLGVCAKICGEELRPFEGQFLPGDRGA
jgi:MoaA/NifB/PqqE/SkfB family radical SAM enzyme